MSLILDYSGIAHAAFFASPSSVVDEGFIRHMILNSARMYVQKYSPKYGQVYLACDGGSWRRDVFPEYKGVRRSNKEESTIDWKEFYRIINMVRDEIADHFPYKVVRVPGAEADDIIAYLTETTQEFGQHEPVMIISSDHDFIQLQRYGNVAQFSPNTKKLVTEKDIAKYSFEQILRGCSGDGIPNFLSDNDTFLVEGKRQKPLSQKRIDALWEVFSKDPAGLEKAMTPEEYKNYIRNYRLVVLDQRPEEISKRIAEEIAKQPSNGNSKIYTYLVEKRCRQLVSSVSDFFPTKTI